MKLLTVTYVKKLGLKSYEQEAEQFAQECLKNYLTPKRQAGGTVMPSDFFGVIGLGYVDADAGTYMAPTPEFARPFVKSTFALSGGCDCFKISKTAFNAFAPAGTSYQKKTKFEALFSKLLKKAAKLDKDVLTKASMQAVVHREKQFKPFV